MKHFLLLIIFIFIAFIATCQPAGNDLKRVLKSKEVSLFNQYLEHNKSMGGGRSRLLIEGYTERIEHVIYVLPKVNKAGSNAENYTIHVLTTGSAIFYCTATKTNYRQGVNGNSWVSYEDTIAAYVDANEYSRFKKQYKEAYYSDVDTRDLFIDSITYGGSCGIAGTPPEQMNELNYFVGTYNVKAIRQWLVSPNAEKQLYGILGYRKLEYAGYDLTREEKEIVNTVKKKTGEVKTCSGCLYGEEKFADVVKEIEEIPGVNLSVKKFVAFAEANEQLPVTFGNNEWVIIKLTVGFLIVLFLVFIFKAIARIYNKKRFSNK